jgi:hypothetical protein
MPPLLDSDEPPVPRPAAPPSANEPAKPPDAFTPPPEPPKAAAPAPEIPFDEAPLPPNAPNPPVFCTLVVSSDALVPFELHVAHPSATKIQMKGEREPFTRGW